MKKSLIITALIIVLSSCATKKEIISYKSNTDISYHEYFTGNTSDKTLCDKVYKNVLREKENICLIGMPASGKTTVGRLIAEKTGKKFVLAFSPFLW
jgi:shikimate dehydrogenase